MSKSDHYLCFGLLSDVMCLTPCLPMATQEAFVDGVDQDQTAAVRAV